MARLWEMGKKAGVAGVFLVSLPVLLPVAMLLTFTGALLAVPVGSAAVGFLVCKKVLGFRKLVEWYEDKHPTEGSEDEFSGAAAAAGPSSTAPEDRKERLVEDDVSAAEAPEIDSSARASDDFIVVEKPSEDHSPIIDQAVVQSKTAPDYFQCVEVEEVAADPAEEHAEEGQDHGGGDAEEAAEDRGKLSEEAFVEVNGSQVSEKDGGGDAEEAAEDRGKPSEEAFVEVNGSQVSEKDGDEPAAVDSASKTNCLAEPVDEEQKQDDEQKKKPLEDRNGSSSLDEKKPKEEAEEPRSSVDEYVSMTEDSDDSVASSRNYSASPKPGVPDKEMRSRLRKELVLVKRVVGFKDAAGGSLADQVERLYSFVGMELPPSCQHTTDYGKLLEAINVIKAVVGVK